MKKRLAFLIGVIAACAVTVDVAHAQTRTNPEPVQWSPILQARGLRHGISIAKGCYGPLCVGETTDCTTEFSYNDDLGDTISVLQAWDVLDVGGDNVRVPAVGDLPISMVGGNTTCVVGGSLPCEIGPAGSTLSGLPGEPEPGYVIFEQNEYVIQADDPIPLPDQSHVVWRDLCDEPTTSNCSTAINEATSPASTLVTDCDDGNGCTIDTCSMGACSYEPVVCDDQSLCTTDACVNGACVYTPSVDCDDLNACTDDSCDPATGMCINDPVVTCPGPTGPCDGGQECDPETGACVDLPNQPDGTSCDDGLFCNGEETCQSGVCEPGTPPCETNEPCITSACDEVQDSCSQECAQPGITCPDDLVFECDVVDPDFGDPVINDDCSVSPIVQCVEDHQPGKLPQEEHIVRTCTVTNDCGNSSECSYTIDIVDTTPPEVTCPPDLEFECDAVGDFGEPMVSDNCDPNPIVTVEVTTVTNNCVPATAGVVIPPKFTTTRTITVSDGTSTIATGNTGNVTQCVQTINIFDTTPPTFNQCPATVGGCIGDPLEFTPPACHDTCGSCTVECTRSDGRALGAPVDSTDVTINCIAYDDCLNASDTCTIAVDTNACNIPTVSEWGIVILTLLLLVGTKLAFGMRPSHEAA